VTKTATKPSSIKIPVKGRSVEERRRVQVTGTCSIRTAAIVQVLAEETAETVGYVLDEVFEKVAVPDEGKVDRAVEKIVADLLKEKPAALAQTA
jgi:hypothetical protein